MNEDSGTGITYHIPNLVFLQGDIGGYGDCPDPPYRKVTDKVLGAAVKIDTDPVSLSYSLVRENQGSPAYSGEDLSVRQFQSLRGSNQGRPIPAHCNIIEKYRDIRHQSTPRF